MWSGCTGWMDGCIKMTQKRHLDKKRVSFSGGSFSVISSRCKNYSINVCFLSDMVVLGQVLPFVPWPPFPRCPQRWATLWREQLMNVNPPMCMWWRGRQRKQLTSWQVWRRKGWSRGFPNMRTGKSLCTYSKNALHHFFLSTILWFLLCLSVGLHARTQRMWLGWKAKPWLWLRTRGTPFLSPLQGWRANLAAGWARQTGREPERSVSLDAWQVCDWMSHVGRRCFCLYLEIEWCLHQK